MTATSVSCAAALLVAAWLGAGEVRADAVEAPTPAVTVASATSARERIESLHAAMLAALRDAEELGLEGRQDLLDPVIREVFDLAFMAEKSVGAHWRKLSDDERTEWLQLFKRFMVASYASRLEGFHGQQFRVHGVEPGGRDTLAVKTEVVDPGIEPVSIVYRMRETSAGWQVIDLYLKGTVSELAVRRSDYAGVLRSGGFTALRESVEEKIAEFATGP